mgnify:CR=1 FL=1
MKKQILSLAVIALLAFAVQSCEKKETKTAEEKNSSFATNVQGLFRLGWRF